jgi:hypothetical protein
MVRGGGAACGSLAYPELGLRMSIIGKVESLWHYPVKSMRGEELEAAFVRRKNAICGHTNIRSIDGQLNLMSV